MAVVLVVILTTTNNFMVGPNPEDFSIEITKIEERESLYAIFGIAESRSSKDWKKLGLEIEFYNQDGEFLDETTGIEAQIPFVASNSKENFKLNIPKVVVDIEGYSKTEAKVASGYSF